MQSILSQLITVPGVVGGMIYDEAGTLLSKTFPPLFDDSLLEKAARVLVDGAAGLETVTGKVGMLDMRFADARIVVRPMAGAHLVLLCAAQTNLQLLNISTSVALPKIEKLVASIQAAPPPEPEPAEFVQVDEGADPGEAPAAPEVEAAGARTEPAEGTQEERSPDGDPSLFRW